MAYYFLTQDAPEGNYKALRAAGKLPPKQAVKGPFQAATRDPRVWALFLIYGACFGIELTVNNALALYFIDYFDFFQSMGARQAVQWAGAAAMLFGLMNVFARTLGGAFGDRQRGGGGGRLPVPGRDSVAAFLGTDTVCSAAALARGPSRGASKEPAAPYLRSERPDGQVDYFAERQAAGV